MYDVPLEEFYVPYLNNQTLDLIEEDAFLQEGEEPFIYYTPDVNSEMNAVLSRFFICIGSSPFNGPSQKQEKLEAEIRELAIRKGAKLVIYDQKYTNTINRIRSTSFGIYSSTIDEYDYNVYYFISTPMAIIKANPLGFMAMNLTQQEKELYRRNTGVIVTTVWNGTPAYYANVILNDIVVGINGVEVVDEQSYFNALAKVDSLPVKVDIIRSGIPYTLEIDL